MGAQEAALYTFKNGKSAKTAGQLVDLCEENRREAEEYLYNGDFERWFLLINRNDLAEAATQAVKQGKNQKDGLEKFLKLILPNLFARRLRRAGLYMARGSLQFVLIAIVIILLLALGGSYIAGWFIQRSISSADWDFSKLNLNGENYYSQEFLTERFDAAAGTYVDDLQVEVSAPDRFNIKGQWLDLPLDMATNIRLGSKNPHLYLTTVNNVPLFWVGDNISQGINNGIDQTFQKGPVDVSRLVGSFGRSGSSL